MQLASSILMIRPANFGYNEQTASSNDYQQRVEGLSKEEIQEKVLAEFDGFVNVLTDAGIYVIVIDDTKEPVKPDAIFPNNWFTTHEDGSVYLFPMKEPNRRPERRIDIIEKLNQEFGVREVTDLSFSENQDLALEGTGSMVFDHDSKTIYASPSARTEREPLFEFAHRIGYHVVIFHSFKKNGLPQYHTNVVMCIGEGFAIVGLDSIPDIAERNKVKKTLEDSLHVIIEISQDQLENHFAGNMLQVMNEEGSSFLIMSDNAFQSLSQDQLDTIGQFTSIIHAPLDLIEKIGGGSARCMMAEIFLPIRA